MGGLGGASPACPTPLDREIDSDFDLFVRGEAKLRERVSRASLSLAFRRGGFRSNNCCYANGLHAFLSLELVCCCFFNGF